MQFFPWLSKKTGNKSVVRWIREGQLEAEVVKSPHGVAYYLISEEAIQDFLKRRKESTPIDTGSDMGV